MLSKIKKLLAAVQSAVQFRVKRWHTAMRGWDEKDIRVIICLEDSIWYWIVLEWLFWDVQTYVCHYTDFVKLPKFIRNWKRAWDKDEPDEITTWQDWYGDSIHSLWHVYVCDPLCQWVWKHKDFHKAWPQWELTLDEARKQFAHDPAIYEWVEKELEHHKEYDAEKLAEKQD
jgi:hypothetical protein